MPWLDIIIIAILVISAIIGLYKGFLQSLINLCGTLLTLILAIWLANPMCNLLDNWFSLSGALGNSVSGTVAGYCESGTLPWIIDKFAGLLLGADYATRYTINSPEFITVLSDAIGHILGVVISAIILFILIKILIKLLSKLFDIITRNRTVNSLDKFLGFLLGTVKGALTCFCICGITYLLSSVLPFLQGLITPLLDNSSIGATFYHWVCSVINNHILPFVFG